MSVKDIEADTERGTEQEKCVEIGELQTKGEDEDEEFKYSIHYLDKQGLDLLEKQCEDKTRLSVYLERVVGK